MGVKFFCNECGVELLKDMTLATKEKMTIAEIEKVCICRYCLTPADITYTTRAEFYGFGNIETIVIEKKGMRVFVNKKIARMMYNGIQLRFEVAAGVGIYIVFDDDSSHQHHPPRPIKEMFESLVG